MIEPDRQEFFVAVGKTLAIYEKLVNPDMLATWYRALKEFSLHQVQTALDQHVKFGRFAPRPGDIVRRINGKDDKGETKEGSHMPTMDRRCAYEQNGARCPATTSAFSLGNRGYCHHHERAKHDPAQMQRILDDILLNGVPFVPVTPHRQRALFLWETGGEAAVLAEFDHRYVTWLRGQEAQGHTKACSWSNASSRMRSAADAINETHFDPEFA